MNIKIHRFGFPSNNRDPWSCCDSLKRDMEDCANLLKQLVPGIAALEDKVHMAWEGQGFYVLRDWDRVEFGAGKIVGMGVLGVVDKPSGTVAYIHDIVVSDDYRGKGLGEMLVRRLIEIAGDAGAEEIELTSNPNNPARAKAIKLYLKLGFKQRETNVYQLKL